VSRVGLAVLRRVSRLPTLELNTGEYVDLSDVLNIIEEEIEAEAERQFTRPISQQAELSKNLKESK
jgi:hypothetical protein